MPYASPEKKRERHREYMRARYQTDSEFRQRQIAASGVTRRRDRAAVSAVIREAKLVGCARCSESDPVALDFHHRDPATKSFEVSAAVSRADPVNAARAEIAKCDVLCANCHRKEHARVP